MKSICFFPLSEGYGILIEIEDNESVTAIKKDLNSKKEQISYGFDFSLELPYLEFGNLIIHLPVLVLEKLLDFPYLHLYIKRREENIAEYLGVFILDVKKLIQLDAVCRVSVLFLQNLPYSQEQKYVVDNTDIREKVGNKE